MTKRTVQLDITVSGSCVVDIDVLLNNLRGGDKHPWAKHLLNVYALYGEDALVQAYVEQAYSGGVNNLLRDWAKGNEPKNEHGGKAKFAPAQCCAYVKPKPALYPKDVPLGGRYKFADPKDKYKGVYTRVGEVKSQADDGTEFFWAGHELHPIKLVV